MSPTNGGKGGSAGGPDPELAECGRGQSAEAAEPARKSIFRRLYVWILSWAHHPMGTWALAFFSFIDSSVFPIPPVFLQIALSLERPRRSFWYAFVDSAASVAGAVLGYYIGYALWDVIGARIIGDLPQDVRNELIDNAFSVTLWYSFVPLPFKLITIGSGFLHLDLATLIIASTLGRSARFFLLAAICFRYGPAAKTFIDKHFNKVLICIALLIGTALFATKVILNK